MSNISFAFFGTSNISVLVLDELKSKGFLPKLIVTTPPKPQGRKLVLTPTETRVWAEKNNISYVELASLKKPEVVETINSYSPDGYDLFVVASYGKIIPQAVLDIPRHQTLNVHPSLLPKLRGPSPLISAILSEDQTGVSIMRLDEEMDHGPILSQKIIDIDWPPYESDLEELAGKMGGEMLSQVIPDWVDGKIKEIPQEHEKATYCQKIKKEDGLLNLEDKPETNLRKIRAFHSWPTAYFFHDKKGKMIRVVVKKASLVEGKLLIERVVPEGKKEMSYQDFLKGN